MWLFQVCVYGLIWMFVSSMMACENFAASYESQRFSSRGNGTRVWSVGGGESVIIHLPFPSGSARLCTQGAKGPYSHQGKSTCFDLDFDTSNVLREELYAPVSGTVYVFNAIATGSPFGNHINIDIGGGYYIVIAHLDTILVCDGCEVAIGQMIAVEGCTGACTGDHIHIGLHKGDASKTAEHGESVEATYVLAGGTLLSSSQFVCGVGGTDDVTGQSYTSALPVVQHHPNGTLVGTVHNPKVYVLENGQRRWILNEQVFWSHGYDFSNLVMISDDELNCYGEGEMISQMGLVDAVIDPSQTLWLVVGAQNDVNRYRVQVGNFGWQSVLASWKLFYSNTNLPKGVGWDHPYLTQWNVKMGMARHREGTLLKEMSSSAVYVASSTLTLPIKNWQTYLALGFLTRPLVYVEDGALFSVESQVGSCASRYSCLDQETIGVCSNGQFAAGDNDGQGGPVSTTPSQPPAQNPPQNDPTQQQESTPPQESPSSDSPSSTPHQTPTTPTSPITQSTCPNSAFACLADLNLDGKNETLLLADDQWVPTMLTGQSAYVYANSGCFDGVLDSNDLTMSSDGYYVVDFSKFVFDCVSELTLVATIGFDGYPPASDMSNWMWWQTAPFCSQAFPICELVSNNTPWEEWLLAVSWHPQTGLVPNGNGFTSNSQL